MSLPLSPTVIKGLKNLGGTSIPLDLTKKLIANSLKLTLHSDATIPPVPEIHATTHADEVKQSEYAVVTLLVLATKHCIDTIALRQLLEMNSIDAGAVEEITRVYDDHRKDLIMRQMQPGHNFPHVTDVQWRMVCDVKSSTSDCSSGEVGFHVNFGRYHQGGSGERETIVEFLCNTEELQSLVSKLKDIERHCEKVAVE